MPLDCFFFVFLLKKIYNSIAAMAKPIPEIIAKESVVFVSTVVSATTDDEIPSLSVTVNFTVYVPA